MVKIPQKAMKWIEAQTLADVTIGYASTNTGGKLNKIYFSNKNYEWTKSVDTNIKVWTPDQEHEYSERGERKHGSKQSWIRAKDIKLHKK